MGKKAETERAPRLRLTAEQRDRFLEMLGQTGNRSYAAAAIGVEERLMDQRRRFDKLLDRQWEEALDQAHRRLAGADGPLDCIGGAEPMVIRRGRGGRLKLVRAGPKRWCRPVEERFFAALTVSGNISAAARSVGFSLSCIANRRRKHPQFEQRLEQVLEDAEWALEYRLAGESGGLVDSAAPLSDTGADAVAEPVKFDPDLAMRFLKWREEKRRGGGQRGRIPALPGREEVIENIVRKVNAVRRHNVAKRLAEGWSQDEEGNMIPPGWVRAAPPDPAEGEANGANGDSYE